MNMLVLAVMWIPGMGSRAERLAKMLDEQEENFKVREFDLNDEAPTGLFEDSQLRLILFVDWWVCARVRCGKWDVMLLSSCFCFHEATC